MVSNTRARIDRLWRELGPSASSVLTRVTRRQLRPYEVGADPDEVLEVWLPKDWRPPYAIEDKRYQYYEN
jgi:hypothetical protein